MQPDNAIMGDSTGVDLPQMQVDDESLKEEKKMAKYSKTAEFARIKEHCEARIAYYQQFLPDGRLIGSSQPTPEDWRVANEIIKELNALMGSYKIATDVVEEETKKNGL